MVGRDAAACPFCHPEDDDRQTVVLANAQCRFIQMPQPVLTGSGIVVPRRHCGTPFDLTPDEWESTFALLQAAKRRLDADLQPEGYNAGWNVGSVAGQEVFHVHLHLIPRFADEPLAGKGIRYGLKQPANRRPT
jgi:histidine triad (HIT) family protein